jgi:hypothetical protein
MSNEKEVPTTTNQAPAPDAQEQSNVAELTVQDLQGLKAIIDVASQRGAFRPNEMMSVGQVYNKLESFLESIAAQQKG